MMVLLALSLLGGVTALDSTSVGQVMISRPLVTGFLAGWLLGEPLIGVTVGAILELYLLVSFPSGGVRFPEGATGTVVAVAGTTALEAPGAMALGVAIGLLWGQMSGMTITLLRRLNGRLVPEEGSVTRPSRTLPARHVQAISLDLVRGTLVSAVGIFVAMAIVRWAAPAWPLTAADANGVLLAGAAASAGIFLRDLGGPRARPVLLAVGLGAGLVLGVLAGGAP